MDHVDGLVQNCGNFLVNSLNFCSLVSYQCYIEQQYIAVLVVNYGISNTIVLEVP